MNPVALAAATYALADMMFTRYDGKRLAWCQKAAEAVITAYERINVHPSKE